MSIYNPPTIFSTIYNPLYFETSTTGLTVGQANALYLKKTVADTATVLETFTNGITVSGTATLNSYLNAAGGIATSDIDSSAASVVINLGVNQSSGVLNIGTGNRTTALDGGGINIGSSLGTNPITINTSSTLNSNTTPAIAIGASSSVKTIKINNPTNSVHCSSIELKNSNINHITANSNNGIIIGDGQTDSTTGLLIGCSTAGNVRTTAPIKIGNDSTFTGAITLGGSSTNINLNGNTAISSLKTDGIDRATTGVFSVGTGTASSVSISKVGANTAIVGSLSVAEGIGLSYSTIPTFTSSQIGYQINTYLGSNLNLNTTNNNTSVLTINLPKGIWQCSYQVRITTIGALNVQVSNVFTTFQSFMNIPILTGGNVLGLNQINIPFTVTSTNGNASNDNYSSSSSAIISNITGTQILSLIFYAVYSGTGTPQAFGSQTYLQALRIA